MQIASQMAGFSLGEADLLRRAVSKKNREVLDQEREHFVRGCVAQGHDETVANKVYDMIVRFADYGFPRAHATAYGVLAFQTAYLKAHYPTAFMASMLTANMGSHRKVAEYIDDCRKMGINVLPPDVNESGIYFTPLADGSIRFGLAAIKNVGTSAMESIISQRQDKPYEDLIDFCRRVDLRACNKRVVESLILAGAFDSLPGHRAQLLAVLDETMEAAQKWKKEREDLQLHLFGFTEEAQWTVEMPEVRPFQRMQQLELERELLGLFLSGHPLEDYEELLARLEPDPLLQLPEYEDDSEVTTAGMIVSVKTIVTRKGQQMAFAELEDQTASHAELVLFPSVWKRCSEMVDKGELVIIRGKLQLQDEGVKLLVDDVGRLDDPDTETKFKRRTPVQLTGSVRTERTVRTVRTSYAEPGLQPQIRGQMQSQQQVQSQQFVQPHQQVQSQQFVQSQAGAGTREMNLQRQLQPGQGVSDQSSSAGSSQQVQSKQQVQSQQQVQSRQRVNPQPPASSSHQHVQSHQVRTSQRVFIKIPGIKEQASELQRLKQVLEQHRGNLPVVLYYERTNKVLALNEEYKIRMTPQLKSQIEAIMGADSVRIK